MRPTGKLHLGNLVGALQNWVKLQDEYESYHFVADWHMLTTGYDNTLDLRQDTWEMVSDWLACGLDPNKATFFVQSRLPEHAELHLLFSMVTPLGWLERVPTYKEQLENIRDHDINTYGFLGYPLLQAADILMYKPKYVPVGEDQVPHVEFAREVARRFNLAFGGIDLKGEGEHAPEAPYWDGLATSAGLGALAAGSLTSTDKTRAIKEAFRGAALDLRAGYLNRGLGKILEIFPEPEALLTSSPRLPGTDGRKMSKSYGNAIFLTDSQEVVSKKLAGYMTDPARQRRTDPGNPDVCPVFDLHKIFSTREDIDRVNRECRTAEIGCVDCKKLAATHLNAFLAPIQERRKPYERNHQLVWDVLEEGTHKARAVAQATMREVRAAVGLAQPGVVAPAKHDVGGIVGRVEALYRTVQSLRAEWPELGFTPDGHLLSGIGKATASAVYGLALETHPAGSSDATTESSRTVKVKVTAGNERVEISSASEAPDLLIVLKFDLEVGFEEIYNGPFPSDLVHGRKPSKRGTVSLRLNQLRRMNPKLLKEKYPLNQLNSRFGAT
jgi:tryptophanyl-tRNA synthetase